MGCKKSITVRTRNFGCIVYPESAPESWMEILKEKFVPAFISPLHNNDVDPQGQPKKEHYHVVLMFDSIKTIEQAKVIFDDIGGIGCEVVNSIRGYARYLCHLDNPEKAQYSVSDVISFCGADYHGVIGLATDKYKAIGDIIDFCELNNILSYSELLVYCRMNRYDWFRVLCDNGTYVVKEYLKSRQWSINKDYMRFKCEVNQETGEVVSDICNGEDEY